jgi:predicted nucleotidyltransferase
MVDANIDIPTAQLDAFCQRYQIQRLALFGSVLREDFRPDSDVDILVTFKPEAQVGFLTLARIKRELSELIQHPVDIVPQVGLNPMIRESILESAQELYAA